MAVGDIYRLTSWSSLNGAVIPTVVFLKQRSPTILSPAEQAMTAFQYAWETWLQNLLSEDLFSFVLTAENLNPATPEIATQQGGFNGLKPVPAVATTSVLRVQASPVGTSAGPAQVLPIPGVAQDDVDVNTLTTAALNTWTVALQNFLAAVALPPLGVVWDWMIVPQGPLAYPLPDPSTAEVVASFTPASALGSTDITNVRIR